MKLASFALVAFLDESVLASENPVFADWPRKPLQEELFGTHVAGETFFAHLQQLLSRQDSPDLADLLEVHFLCMVLGFSGRYSGGYRSELHQIMNVTADKIRRIRGRLGPLSPAGSASRGNGAGEGGPVDPAARNGRHRVRGAAGGPVHRL